MSEMIQVPDGWEVKKVSSLCKILDNQRIPLNDEERQNMKGHIPYYGANAIVDYIDSYLFDEDLILLAEDGGNFDEYENRPISFKISGKSWVNNHAHILKPNKNVEFDYVFYSLEHKNITSYIRGGTRSKLNQSDLRDVDVLIPKEKKEQEKIANILSTLDKAIESTNRLIEKEKNIKKALMQELLTNGIDKDGHIRTRATHTYKESELGMIPEEWEIVSLGEISTKISDGIHATPVYSDSSNFYFINGNNLENGKIIITEKTNCVDEEEYKKYKLELTENTILLSINGTIGNIAFYKNEKVVLGKSAAYIICKNNIDIYFLSFLLSSHAVLQSFELNLTGSTIKNLSIRAIRETKIIYPSMPEQKQIAKILTTQDKKIETEETNLAKLKELKKGVMNDLLSGKVRVMV
ncbi:restriction endonuclease subunit S [Candidatus Parcubacteria bacterium]|nr:MAG: restriction endonuclease subunit S [Candidatus Parcubacteria bacterium]